jgi:uncharacterized integral membrane protein
MPRWRSFSDDPRTVNGCCYTQPASVAASTPGVLVKDILIALLIIAVVILVFGAVNQDQRIDFNYIAGTWHGASTFALAGIGAGVTLFAGLGVAAVARMHVLGGRRKLEREVEQVYMRLRAAEAASPAAAEASRAAVRTPPILVTASAPADVPPVLTLEADAPPLPPAEMLMSPDSGSPEAVSADEGTEAPAAGTASVELADPEGTDQS